MAVTGLANPQWTPPLEHAPGWMRFGFELFTGLRHLGQVVEVFPSASYSQLGSSAEPAIELSFNGFASGPKDVLDAYVGAVTAREFILGRGCEVGGGDGLGTILLPRKLTGHPSALMTWPG